MLTNCHSDKHIRLKSCPLHSLLKYPSIRLTGSMPFETSTSVGFPLQHLALILGLNIDKGKLPLWLMKTLSSSDVVVFVISTLLFQENVLRHKTSKWSNSMDYLIEKLLPAMSFQNPCIGYISHT